ncbi:MAG TPA: LD-carboxypeptidase [Fulvivirga sp.]|nr:LD-carboxypeptidase [Fulvivirga sp.]
MISPPLLKSGDKVAIVSPSRMITKDQLVKARKVLTSWDLEVVLGEHVYDQQGYFAGTDAHRLSDLQAALDDHEIKAIFCSRGGYGMSRIIDNINLKSIVNQPKWVVGFSDITALHLKLHQSGMESIHGLMPVQFEYEGVDKSIESLKNLLFNGVINYNIEANENNRQGTASGLVIGGNLSLLVDSLATGTELETKGKILFVEEIDEYLYKIDRMFNHLKRSGKLNGIKGLIIGDFSQMKDTSIPYGKNIEELILEYAGAFSGPIAFGFPIGHEAYHIAIPCGRQIMLKVNKEGTTLLG